MKLLIVDDNIQIREGIAKGIEWEKYGIKKILICADGLEAHQQLQTFKPDVIIADICMPNMDGLELLKKVHESNLSCRFILLSAYSEFKYAQQAIRFGANDYILKPINPQKLIELVVKNIHDLHDTRTKIHDYYNVYEKLFLNTLLAGEKIKTPSQLKNCLKTKYEIVFENNLIYTAILKVTPKNPYDSPPVSDTPSVLTPLSNHSRCIIPLPTESDCFLLIGEGRLSRMQSHIVITELQNQLFQINRTLETKKIIITAGISDIFNLSEIHSAYKQANAVFNLTYYKESGAILRYEEYSNISLSEFSEAQQKKYIDQITTAVQTMNEDLLRNIFSALYTNILKEHYCPADVNDFFLSLYFHLIQHTKMEKSFEFEKHILNAHFDTVFSYFQSLVLQSVEDNSFLLTGNYSRLIQNICIYLNEHFREPLTVESVAKEFDRTPNYISAKFKKEVGKTFTDYLIELRIQKATAMLAHTNHSISRIAKEVGFNSYAYFSKTFRKYTGKNAGSFRNN